MTFILWMLSCHSLGGGIGSGLHLTTMKYEEALKRLEKIVSQMENDELDIDTLSEQLKEAQQLIKQCRDRLTKTDEEIKKLLNEEQ